MIFPWIQFLKEGEGVGIANFHMVPSFNGAGSTESNSGGVAIEVKDGDTVKVIKHDDFTEGTSESVHEQDNSTSYQNTSGSTAICVIIIRCTNSGAEERHFKIYSAPTDNSTASANLVYEFGSEAASTFMDALNDRLTTPPLPISDNHFIVVENVDDSRAGTNNIQLNGIDSVVVERL